MRSFHGEMINCALQQCMEYWHGTANIVVFKKWQSVDFTSVSDLKDEDFLFIAFSHVVTTHLL